jgi:hypothetical protein
LSPSPEPKLKAKADNTKAKAVNPAILFMFIVGDVFVSLLKLFVLFGELDIYGMKILLLYEYIKSQTSV